MSPARNLLALLSLAFCAPAWAAPALSIEDAVRLALLRAPEVQLAKRGVEAASADLVGARSEFLPSLDSSLTYDLSANPATATVSAGQFAPGLPPTDDTLFLVGRHVLTGRLSLVQSLYAGGASLHAYRASRGKEEAASLRLWLRKLEIEREVVTSYLGLNHCRLALRALSDAVEYYRHHDERTRTLFDSGSVPELELRSSRAHLLEATSDLSTQRADCLERSQEFERRVHGSEAAMEQAADGAVPELAELSRPQATELLPEPWLREVLAHNLELRIAAAEEEASGDTALAVRGKLFPRLDLIGFVEFQSSDLTPDRTNPGVEVRLGFPIFEWGRTKSQYDKAAISSENASTLVEDERLRLRSRVASLIARVRATRDAAEASQALAEYRADELRVIDIRKSLSNKTQLQYFGQKVAFLKTQVKTDELWRDYESELAELYFLAGRHPAAALTGQSR